MPNKIELRVKISPLTTLFQLQTLFKTSNGPSEEQIDDNHVLCITSKTEGLCTLMARNGTISFYDEDGKFRPEGLTDRTISMVIEKFCEAMMHSHHCIVQVTGGETNTGNLKIFKFELMHNRDNYIFQKMYEYSERELCGPSKKMHAVYETPQLEDIKGVELLQNKQELIELNISKYYPMSILGIFFLKIEKGVIAPNEIEYEGSTYAQHYAQVTAKPEQLSDGCKVRVYEKLIYRDKKE